MMKIVERMLVGMARLSFTLLVLFLSFGFIAGPILLADYTGNMNWLDLYWVIITVVALTISWFLGYDPEPDEDDDWED